MELFDMQMIQFTEHGEPWHGISFMTVVFDRESPNATMTVPLL
jgi:hypothetical protein